MVVFLILYVDDILLIENDIPALQEIKVWLSSQFSMKDLGEASYILEMKIYKDISKKIAWIISVHVHRHCTEEVQHVEFQEGLSIDRP